MVNSSPSEQLSAVMADLRRGSKAMSTPLNDIHTVQQPYSSTATIQYSKCMRMKIILFLPHCTYNHLFLYDAAHRPLLAAAL